MTTIKIGIIGYSDMNQLSEADQQLYPMWITFVLGSAINFFRENDPTVTFELVGGLTNIGVNKYAYAYAKSSLSFTKTVGFACSKANEFPCFPVDEKHIIGNEWGDESNEFLDYIDCLVKIGGGKQSDIEFSTFKERYPDKKAECMRFPV